MYTIIMFQNQDSLKKNEFKKIHYLNIKIVLRYYSFLSYKTDVYNHESNLGF